MKKLFLIFIVIILAFTYTVPAFGWSVPEDLSSENNAKIYFAETVKVFSSENTAVVRPVKLIKGDVPLNKLYLVKNVYEPLIPGNVYIFASISENIDMTCVFSPTSYNTDTLSFYDKDGNNERLIRYINEGKYKNADNERIDGLNEELSEKVRYPLTKILNLSENTDEEVSVTEDYSIPYSDFYAVCKDIEVCKIKDHGTYSEYIIADFSLPEASFRITSDAKLITGKNSYYAEYILSSSDRDKLLSLIPEEELSLPFMRKGTVILAASSIIILTSAFLTATIFISKKKKHKS